MVMIEALACGTPVVAFAEGAAMEIVLDGQNGFLVDDEDEMVAAISRLSELDPVGCRASVAARYDGDLVTTPTRRLPSGLRNARRPAAREACVVRPRRLSNGRGKRCAQQFGG